MKRHRFERALVLVSGFLLGAGLAVCVAPGDVLLWFVAGIVLSIFCHEHFVSNCGGELFGWFTHRHDHPPKTPLGPRTG